MSNIITDEHHSFEMGSGSKRKKIVVCPYCKNAFSVSVNWIAGACMCGKYFNIDTALGEAEAVGMIIRNSVDKGRLELKKKQEAKVEQWIGRQKK